MNQNFSNFQNSGNGPNMNSNNTMFQSSSFGNGPNMNMNQGNNNNFNFMNASQTMTMRPPSTFKSKLNVQLTREENMLYNKLYNMLDNNNVGRILAKPAANFMKTSGLDKNTLKKIWLTAAVTSNTQIEKDEFFVALRLIALAQNNMPFSEENIERNSPIPPLPQFNLNMNSNNQNNIRNKNTSNNNNFQNQNNNNFNNNQNNNQYENNNFNNNNNSNNQNSIFDISESEKINYKNIFDNQKEPNIERIKARNAILVWKDNNADDQSIRIVANLINPLENKGFMNLKEFQVACHLINISKKVQLPPKLPLSMINFLGRNNINNNNNAMRFNSNINNNNNNINNNIMNAPEISRINTNSTFSPYLNTNNDLNESNFSLNSKQISNAPFGNKNENMMSNTKNN